MSYAGRYVVPSVIGEVQFDRRPKGVNFWGGSCKYLGGRVIELPPLYQDFESSDHSWPEVATKSVDRFWVEAVSNKIRVPRIYQGATIDGHQKQYTLLGGFQYDHCSSFMGALSRIGWLSEVSSAPPFGSPHVTTPISSIISSLLKWHVSGKGE